MDTQLNNKLNDLIVLIENNPNIKELKKIKKELLNDKEFIDLLNEIKNKPYISKEDKEKLFKNEKYKKYQHLENEILFLTLEINKKLNTLTDKSRC